MNFPTQFGLVADLEEAIHALRRKAELMNLAWSHLVQGETVNGALRLSDAEQAAVFEANTLVLYGARDLEAAFDAAFDRLRKEARAA